MPRYSVDYYLDDIYVKTFIVNDDDKEAATARVQEMIEDEQMLDVEEIDV